MAETLAEIGRVVMPTFVIVQMGALGLGLRPSEVLRPLADLRATAVLLLATFGAAPLAVAAAARALDVDAGLAAGLTVLSLSAGSPLLPRMVARSGGPVAWAVGATALLVVATVAVLSLALPWVLPAQEVPAAPLAATLAGTLLLPLALGLGARAVAPRAAARLRPWADRAAQAVLAAVIVLVVAISLPELGVLLDGPALLAVGALYAAPILAVAVLMPSDWRPLALATTQRNVAAALLVTTGALGAEVAAFVLLAALIGRAIAPALARFPDPKDRSP